MLHEKKLDAALRALKGVARHGPFSRCVGYQHLAPVPKSRGKSSRPQPLWGMGSKRFGGRFTPQNSFETIYLAEHPVTALAEVSGVLLTTGGTITLHSLPWVTVTVDGTLLSVLDVSDMGIQAKLGTTSQELTGEWRYTQAGGGESPTQNRTVRWNSLSFNQEPAGRAMLGGFPRSIEITCFP